jgi:hypothetical protein
MSQEVIKKFDLVRNTVLESNANNKERIADKITELEFFVLDALKIQRDFVRAGLEDIRDAYRPVRELSTSFNSQISQQVDKVSKQCSLLEKGLR